MKEAIIKNFKKVKWMIFLVTFLFIVFFIFLPIHHSHAWDPTGVFKGAVISVISLLPKLANFLLGIIISLVISAVISISQYNNFINESSIIEAWVIVRDLCNMFFILILLVIAFATILGLENYSIKKNLPKLIIMAILINFSRTICGLVIDFGQVIMLTFIRTIGNSGGAYINTLGVDKFFIAVNAEKWTGDLNVISTLAGMILSTIFLVIAIVVLVVLLAVLVMRIIYLWIFIVLSPLAFLLASFPAGQKYSQQWWSDFSKNVTVGPLLAFFLWLALASAQATSVSIIGSDTCFGPLEILCPGNFLNFIIAIGMLMGGLIVTQDLGARAGSAAGKGIAAIQSGKALTWSATKGVADWANRFQATNLKTGIDLNPFRQMDRIKGTLDRNKKRSMYEMEALSSKRLEEGGITGAVLGITATGWGDQYLQGAFGSKGIAKAWKGGLSAQKNIKELRDKEKEASWKARHIFTDDETSSAEKKWQDRYDEKDMDAQIAKEDGLTEKAVGIRKEMKRMVDEKDSLIIKNKEEAAKKQAEYVQEAEKSSDRAGKIMVVDYEGLKARRAAENEEASKITSDNEDELVAQFESAIGQNNVPLAAALARAIAKISGANTLLTKYGYHPKSGLNEQEAEELKKTDYKTYMNERGFHDFMRDVFEKKLGLDRQSTLAIQSDMGGIGQQIGHEYLAKNVGVDSAGRFYQMNAEQTYEVKLTEKLKREPEKVIRNNHRLEYGGENAFTGKFEWDKAGMAYFIKNIRRVSEEIKNGRFNVSAATKISEKDASADLLKALKAREAKGLKLEYKGKDVSAEDFITILQTYSQTKVTNEEDVSGAEAEMQNEPGVQSRNKKNKKKRKK